MIQIDTAYSKMEADAKKHVYTHSFSDFYYGKMKESEKTVRKDDLLFCGAPHLFIAHERCAGKWAEDSKVSCIIATAYFELLCNAHESVVIAMMEQQRDMRVPSALLPVCPHCGKPMTMNLRVDDRFVEDEGYSNIT